ncbi:hypothetical protein FHX44_116320 [Pseudonocardia hierapolitana]|uniref:Uncharacterized protein n=1 Tax=Pseudonocardia hierapolitana TaxID=1128676 RepID=A0A561SZV2_9PSEU|nr:hypothetical protein FHX44_116320 [Pseudonocardia hierapolitana]
MSGTIPSSTFLAAVVPCPRGLPSPLVATAGELIQVDGEAVSYEIDSTLCAEELAVPDHCDELLPRLHSASTCRWTPVDPPFRLQSDRTGRGAHASPPVDVIVPPIRSITLVTVNTLKSTVSQLKAEPIRTNVTPLQRRLRFSARLQQARRTLRATTSGRPHRGRRRPGGRPVRLIRQRKGHDDLAGRHRHFSNCGTCVPRRWRAGGADTLRLPVAPSPGGRHRPARRDRAPRRPQASSRVTEPAGARDLECADPPERNGPRAARPTAGCVPSPRPGWRRAGPAHERDQRPATQRRSRAGNGPPTGT